MESKKLYPVEPIAITGIGCRLPGGVEDVSSYWRMLCDGVDAMVDVPRDRWDSRRYYDPDPQKPGKLYIRQGGFLRGGIDGFDAGFFRMSPREAARLDPQQRLLLEVTWEALEDAGLSLERLSGSDTGVYVGGFTADHLVLQASALNREQIDTHSATGVGFTMLAARLSYTFDLRGPSLTIDTACSSSLVAMHHACNGIWAGECSQAIVGGVNVIFNPEFVVVMCKGGFLSPDARCKAFDSRANGYARGEGAAALVLKPLRRALDDGDPIYAVVRGTACNQDGFSNGITVPSQSAQEALMRRAYSRAGVSPSEVAYVEAHGTGTPVGDPIEAKAIGAVIGAGRSSERPCLIGSVKTNIGHLEAASGMAGVIKAALVLKHRFVPQHLHFLEPNPNIPFESLGLEVARTARPLHAPGENAFAGVNSFGYGGTNAHVVLEEAPREARPTVAVPTPEAPRVFVLSARGEVALRATAERWCTSAILQGSPSDELLEDLSYNAAVRRTHHEERAAIVARSASELTEALRGLALGEPHPALSRGRAPSKGTPRLAFVYTGMGPQWWGMGRELFAKEPIFRAELERCDALMSRIGNGLSLIEELHRPEAESRMAQTLIAQTTNFAVQAGVTALWRHWGVVPEAVVGHSVGEVGAAYASGALSLEDALTVSFHRARLQAETAGQGGMLAVGLTEAEADALLEGRRERVSLAAVNAPDAVTLAGDLGALADIAAELQARQVFHRQLRVEIAYHSPQMNPLEQRMKATLSVLRPRVPTIPLYSTVTGKQVTDASWGGDYWWHNVRDPVRFADAADVLIAEGYDVFVEVGPHPVLSASLKSCLARRQRTAEVLPSLHREKPEQVTMRSSLGALHVRGVPVDLTAVHDGPRPYLRLPSYPWQRERYWSESSTSTEERLGSDGPALPGRPLREPRPTWERELNAQHLPWLPDHIVEGSVVFPAAGYVASALAAASTSLGTSGVALERLALHRPLLVGPEEPVLRTSLHPEARRFSVHSRSGSTWTLHVEGTFAPSGLFPAQVPEDASALARRCPRQVPRDEVYSYLAASGLKYGPAFQTIESLSVGEREVFMHLRARIDATGELLHPTLLDACFHGLLCALPGLDGAFVPVSLERLVAHQPCPPRAQVWGRMTHVTRSSLEADLFILDEAGGLVVEVRGLCCQRLPSARDASSGKMDHLYQEQWAPLPPSGDVPETAAGTYLVLCGPTALTEALVKALEGRGGRVIQIASGSDEGARGEVSLRRALQEVARSTQASCRAVIDLSALEEAYAQEPARAAMRQAPRTLSLMQALSRTRWKKAPRLWLITRGTHALGPRGERPPVPTLAPLWGLARVLANEQPDLRPSLIDLDPMEQGEADLAALVHEILADAAESEIAWRGEERFVHRLVRLDAASLGHRTVELAAKRLVLEATAAADAEPVSFRESARCVPGPGEVEIRVEAAALGEQDLRALGRRAGAELGSECTGRVVACGLGVTQLSVGDAVMAVARGSMRTHVIVPASLVVRRPEGAPLVQAAAPLTLAAALHAAESLNSLHGEPWVLVHGADGLGGRATVHLARARGARVLFTADDDATVHALQRTGARHVGSTRTLRFVDQVSELTQGHGLALIVQWSSDATGGRLPALLSDGGRLVQLAPVEGEAGAAPARNAVVERLELARLPQSHAHRLATWLAAMAAALGRGDFGPDEGTVLAPAAAATAYAELLRGAAHTPLAVSFEEGTVTAAPPREGPFLSPDATYLIIGGLRGFGLATARWMVQRGARHLVLVSRGGQVADKDAPVIAAMQAAGASVRPVAADITDEAQLEELMAAIDRGGPPLRGVVNAATVYDDELIQRIDGERLSAVMGPKVLGAWALHRATKRRTLDFFLLYSSGSSVLGFQGQSAYAAGNLFLDALAEHRRALGLPASSFNWGAIDSGFVARDESVARRLEQQGADALAMEGTLDTLALLLRADVSRCMPMVIRWPQWAHVYPHSAAQPRFAAVAAPESSGESGSSLKDTLTRAEPSQRRAMLLDAIRERVAIVFGLAPARIDPTHPLRDMALDSLTAAELKNRIDRDLGISVPLWRLLEGQSVTHLAESMAAMMNAAEAPNE